jgi:Holliday junction resolvasome RuvABC endonuclease subunit
MKGDSIVDVNSILLYNEALAACGFTVIKTDELEKLKKDYKDVCVCRTNAITFQNEIRSVLIEVMSWIYNYKPPFATIKEWNETKEKVNKILGVLHGEGWKYEDKN